MNTMEEVDLMEIQGGIAGLLGAALTAYMGFLNKVEQNPQDYTWTMDWYYQQN
jgi:hypothetical protein